MSTGVSNNGTGRAMVLWLGLAALSAAFVPAAPPQNDSQIRPKSDYMGTILSRNTTIGLRYDKILQKMISQTSRKWAVRSSTRHILD